jgi:hypothetical protein
MAAEMVKGRCKGVQQKMVPVILNHGRLTEIQRGRAHVQMNVGKAGAALVLMVDKRRDQDDVPRAVRNDASVIAQPSGAAGAVDELPARMCVPGHGKGYQVLSCINYFSHVNPLLSTKRILAKKIRFVHIIVL